MKNILFTTALMLAAVFAAASCTSCGGDDGGDGGKSGKATLSTEVSALSFTCGTYYPATFEVLAENVEWDVVPGDTWVHAVKTLVPGTLNGTVTISVDKNPGKARTSTVTLSGKGIEPVVIPVAQKEAFASELSGSYEPSLVYSDAVSDEIGDLFLDSSWKNGTGPDLPIQIAALGGAVPWYLVDAWLLPMVGVYYRQGLDSFTFRDDGTLAAGYHAVESGDFMSGIDFAKEIIDFPNAETLKVLPADALGYYTENGMVYFTVSKSYLNGIGEKMLQIPNLCGTIIDGLLGEYDDLTIVSTDDYYAVPFKYSFDGGKVTLLVDRDMMLPYRPLLTNTVVPLLLSMVDAATLQELGIDPENPEPVLEFVNKLFDESTKLDLGLRLTRR